MPTVTCGWNFDLPNYLLPSCIVGICLRNYIVILELCRSSVSGYFTSCGLTKLYNEEKLCAVILFSFMFNFSAIMYFVLILYKEIHVLIFMDLFTNNNVCTCDLGNYLGSGQNSFRELDRQEQAGCTTRALHPHYS